MLQAQGTPFQYPLTRPRLDGLGNIGFSLLYAYSHSTAVVIAVPGKQGPFRAAYLWSTLTSASPELLAMCASTAFVEADFDTFVEASPRSSSGSDVFTTT